MKLSPSLRRILMALDRHGDMQYDEIAERAHVAPATIRDGGYMLKLHIMQLVRVSRWVRSESGGPPSPVWSVSPGESKPKPKPYTDAQKYRANKQAKDSLIALLNITTSQKGL